MSDGTSLWNGPLEINPTGGYRPAKLPPSMLVPTTFDASPDEGPVEYVEFVTAPEEEDVN